MSNAYPALSVANAFLDIAKEKGAQLTNMKLQKLLYFAHGWSLALRNQPLIDEQVEAWQYGPVFQSVYHEFKRFGASPISCKASELIPVRFAEWQELEYPVPDSPEVIDLLKSVWNTYGVFSAADLSRITHTEGSPWYRAFEESGGAKNTDIPKEYIEEHFKELASRAKKKAKEQAEEAEA